jgi:hypothetical protein
MRTERDRPAVSGPLIVAGAPTAVPAFPTGCRLSTLASPCSLPWSPGLYSSTSFCPCAHACKIVVTSALALLQFPVVFGFFCQNQLYACSPSSVKLMLNLALR